MSYDSWLEAPYQRRAALEAVQEQIEEDVWNADHNPDWSAIQQVADYLAGAGKLHDRFLALISDLVAEMADDPDTWLS